MKYGVVVCTIGLQLKERQRTERSEWRKKDKKTSCWNNKVNTKERSEYRKGRTCQPSIDKKKSQQRYPYQNPNNGYKLNSRAAFTIMAEPGFAIVGKGTGRNKENKWVKEKRNRMKSQIEILELLWISLKRRRLKRKMERSEERVEQKSAF
jgi:hypothetical protein